MEDSDFLLKKMDEEIEDFEERKQKGRNLLRNYFIAIIQSGKTEISEDNFVNLYFKDGISPEDEFFLNLDGDQGIFFMEAYDEWLKIDEEKRLKIFRKLKDDLESNKEILDNNPIDQLQKNVINQIKDIKDHSIDPNSNKMLIDVVNEFINHTINIKSRGKSKPLSNSTINSYKSILFEFVTIVNGDNILIQDLSSELINRYDEYIWKVPLNFMKKKIYQGKDIKEIIRMSEKENLKTKSNETIKNHTMRVKEFLGWASKKGYINKNLSDNINKVNSTYVKDNQKVLIFTPDELKKLFNNPIIENKLFDYPCEYWMPLIALLSGMRGNEIAQLYTDDIVKDSETEIYYFSIRYNPSKKQTTKNINANRDVPLHNLLIKLGLLNYINGLKNENKMLFPELMSEDGNYYKKFGNRFNRKDKYGWKWKLGVTRDGVKFHSFRHNVISQLSKNDKVNDRIVCELVGHECKNIPYVANYVKDYGLREKKQAIDMIRYDSIDFDKINIYNK